MGRGSSKAGGGYTSFSDAAHMTAWGTSTGYEGDGKAQEEFFKANSNSYELINEIAGNEQDALDFSDWAAGIFMHGQQYDGWDSMTQVEQRRTRTYDKYLDRSVLKKGVVVARNADAQLILGKGNKEADFEAIKKMQGRTITSAGNMSFSAASTGLNVGGHPPITYKLKIKGGTKGAGMWIGDDRVNIPFGNTQREFMVNRNSAFKVGKATQDKNGHITVELEYQCGLEHDYGKK